MSVPVSRDKQPAWIIPRIEITLPDSYPEEKTPLLQDEEQKKSDASRLLLMGVLLALGSGLCDSSGYSLNKYSSLPAEMTGIYRSTIMFIFTLSMALLQGQSIILRNRKDMVSMVLTGICSLGTVSSFFSVKFISLTEYTLIMYSSPLITMILGRLLLNEPFGLFECMILVFTLSGVVVAINPVKISEAINSNIDIKDHITGCLLALSRAFFVGLSTIFQRKLKHIHTSVVVFWMTVFTLFFSLVMAVILMGFALPDSLGETCLMVGFGFTGIGAEMFYAASLHFINVGMTIVTNSSSIVFSAVYQVVLFHDPVKQTSIFGGILIGTSIVLVNTKSWIMEVFNKLVLRKTPPTTPPRSVSP